MVKKLRCTVAPSDFIRVSDWRSDSDIALQVKVGEKTEDIFLTFADAKKLRKQIKKALAEIEGEEYEDDNVEAKEEPAYTPHVGEVVEVFQNTVDHAFQIGRKVRVVEIVGESVKAESLNGLWCWWIEGDIKPIQDWKPKEGEKVLIVGSTFMPCQTTRSWIGSFGVIGSLINDDVIQVYNEDKSDYFGFNLSDLRPAE